MYSLLLANFIVECTIVFSALDTIATQEIHERFQTTGGEEIGNNLSAFGIVRKSTPADEGNPYEFLEYPDNSFGEYELHRTSHDEHPHSVHKRSLRIKGDEDESGRARRQYHRHRRGRRPLHPPPRGGIKQLPPIGPVVPMYPPPNRRPNRPMMAGPMMPPKGQYPLYQSPPLQQRQHQGPDQASKYQAEGSRETSVVLNSSDIQRAEVSSRAGRTSDSSVPDTADSYMAWANQFMSEPEAPTARTTNKYTFNFDYANINAATPAVPTALTTISKIKDPASEYLSWAQKVLATSASTTIRPVSGVGQQHLPNAPRDQFPPKPAAANSQESRQNLRPAPPLQQRYQQMNPGSGRQNPMANAQVPQRPGSAGKNNGYFNNPANQANYGSRKGSASATPPTASTKPAMVTPVSEPQKNTGFFDNPAYGNKAQATPPPSPKVLPNEMKNDFFNNPAYGLQPPPPSPSPSRPNPPLTQPTTQTPLGQRNPDFVNIPANGIQSAFSPPSNRENFPPNNSARGPTLGQQNQVMHDRQRYNHRPIFRPALGQNQQGPPYQVNGQAYNGPMYANQPHQAPFNPSTQTPSSSTEATTTENTDFFNNPAYGNVPAAQKPPQGPNSQWNQPNFDYATNLGARGQFENSPKSPDQAPTQTTTELNWFDYEKYRASPILPPKRLSKAELMQIWERNMAAVQATSPVPQMAYVTVPPIVAELDQVRAHIATSSTPAPYWQQQQVGPSMQKLQQAVYQQPVFPTTASMGMFFNHPAYGQNYQPARQPETSALTAGSGSLADYDVVKNFYADNEGQPLRTQKKNGKFYEKQDEQQEKEHGSLKHRFHNAMGTINHFFSSAPSSPFLTPSKISITIVTVHLITICIETHKRYFLKYY